MSIVRRGPEDDWYTADGDTRITNGDITISEALNEARYWLETAAAARTHALHYDAIVEQLEGS